MYLMRLSAYWFQNLKRKHRHVVNFIFLVLCISAVVESICKRCSFECRIGKLVQGIRCEPLDEHLISWTCAVFDHTARKWAPSVFSHTTVQNFQLWSTCVQSTDMTDDHKVVNRRRSVNRIPRSLSIQHVGLYKMYTCSTTECGIGWYRHTSHSGNTASECENVMYHTQ